MNSGQADEAGAGAGRVQSLGADHGQKGRHSA